MIKAHVVLIFLLACELQGLKEFHFLIFTTPFHDWVIVAM